MADKVGLPYLSPHKFRNGNAVYLIKKPKDIGDLKAISQNLMHSNISVTDGVYGILSEGDVKNRIDIMSGNAERANNMSNEQLTSLLEEAAARL